MCASVSFPLPQGHKANARQPSAAAPTRLRRGRTRRHCCFTMTDPALQPTDPTSAGMAPSLRRRMACWLYEGALLFGVVVGTGLFFFGLVFAIGHLVPSLSPLRDAVNSRASLQAYVFVLLALYFGWFWSKGQTLAMKTWHVRVVDLQGRPLSRAHALWRYVLSWLWFLPPLAAGAVYRLPASELTVIVLGWVWIWALLARFHPQRQFWHDALAGTRLVPHPSGEAKREKTADA